MSSRLSACVRMPHTLVRLGSAAAQPLCSSQEREEMARTLLAEHRSTHELQHDTMLIECRQTAPTMGPPMGQDPGADVGGVSPVLVQMWEG